MGLKAITFLFIFAVVISSVTVGWLTDISYRQMFGSNSSEASAKVSLVKFSGRALANALDQETEKAKLIASWTLSDDISVKLVSLDDVSIPYSLLEDFKAGDALLLESKNGPSFSYYLRSSEQILQVSSDTFFEQDEQSIQLIMTILFYAVLSLILTLLVYPLTKRLFAIKQASASFGRGELNTRLNVGNISGIRDVELAFNAMASRIQVLLDDIKLLSGGVSHDLKTSLARLRFGIDTIQDSPDMMSTVQLERLSEDTDDMIHLVNMMLSYTQLDMNLSKLEKRNISLNELVKETVDKTFKYDLYKHLKLNMTLCERNCKVNGNKLYLKMVVNNLISNAIYYAKSHVDIELHSSENEVYLSVTDDGCGIPKQYQHAVFKPFFRVPKQTEAQTSRNKENHHGLGLAISHRIIEMHKGYITLTSESAVDETVAKKDMTNDHLPIDTKAASYNKSPCKTGTVLLICLPLVHKLKV